MVGLFGPDPDFTTPSATPVEAGRDVTPAPLPKSSLPAPVTLGTAFDTATLAGFDEFRFAAHDQFLSIGKSGPGVEAADAAARGGDERTFAVVSDAIVDTSTGMPVFYLRASSKQAAPAGPGRAPEAPAAALPPIRSIKVGETEVSAVPVSFTREKKGAVLVLGANHVPAPVSQYAAELVSTKGITASMSDETYRKKLAEFLRSPGAGEVKKVDRRIAELQSLIKTEGVTVICGEFPPGPGLLEAAQARQEQTLALLNQRGVPNPGAAADELMKLQLNAVGYMWLKGMLGPVHVVGADDETLRSEVFKVERNCAALQKDVDKLAPPHGGADLHAAIEKYGSGEFVTEVEAQDMAAKLPLQAQKRAMQYLSMRYQFNMLNGLRDEALASNALREGAASTAQTPVVVIAVGSSHGVGVTRAVQRKVSGEGR